MITIKGIEDAQIRVGVARPWEKSKEFFCEVLWANEGIKICRIITLEEVEHIRIAFLLKKIELNAYFQF